MPKVIQSLSNKQMITVLALSKDPTCIFTTKELKVGFANNALLSFWDKGAEVIGMELYDAMPELRGTRFPAELKEVWLTGKNFQANDVRAELFVGGKPTTRYFDYIFKALANEDGRTYAILHTATEVTERVHALQTIKGKDLAALKLTKELTVANANYRKKNDELHTLNEDYATSNEELESSYKKLSALREELEKVNQLLTFKAYDLSESNTNNAGSEKSELAMLADAPIAMSILKGKNMVIKSANAKMLEIWGKSSTVIGQKLAIAFPELDGQKYLGLLDEVFVTGNAFYGVEEQVFLNRNNADTECFFTFVYHPLKDQKGFTEGIVIVANEVTAQIKAGVLVQELNENVAVVKRELKKISEEVNLAHKKAQKANEKLNKLNQRLQTSQKQAQDAEKILRHAIDAANFGTWNIDCKTRVLTSSPRLKELFGFLDHEWPTLEDCIAQILPEYQNQVTTEIEKTINNRSDYDISYKIIGFHDKITRWIRAVGNVSLDDHGNYSSFTGVIMDITQQKQHEQLKNDFISMVSHELKTPLTSLMAYIQMLQLTLKTADDRTIDILTRSRRQATKMSNMITGFLDVSRFESGELYLKKSEFSLAALIVEVINDAELTTTTHQLIFEKSQDFSIIADREKIAQVIQNLISNAVKYSPQGENIEISFRKEHQHGFIIVHDYGTGVKAEDLNKLFRRFYRVQNDRTTTIAGFGIGLYLCAEIAKRHDGRIWVESDGENGSTFYFSLPLVAG